VDTLLEWTLLYRRNGLAALHPKPRKDRGQLRAITDETAALIERLKRENPSRTGTALLNQLALANGNQQEGVSPSTVYRFLRARGLTERQLLLDKAAATSHKKYRPNGPIRSGSPICCSARGWNAAAAASGKCFSKQRSTTPAV